MSYTFPCMYLGIYHICKAKGQDKSYKSGMGSIQDCKFPFKQSGMEHNGCAPSHEKGKGPRCATEVDKQGNLKKWARCNKFCLADPGMDITYILTKPEVSVA